MNISLDLDIKSYLKEFKKYFRIIYLEQLEEKNKGKVSFQLYNKTLEELYILTNHYINIFLDNVEVIKDENKLKKTCNSFIEDEKHFLSNFYTKVVSSVKSILGREYLHLFKTSLSYYAIDSIEYISEIEDFQINKDSRNKLVEELIDEIEVYYILIDSFFGKKKSEKVYIGKHKDSILKIYELLLEEIHSIGSGFIIFQDMIKLIPSKKDLSQLKDIKEVNFLKLIESRTIAAARKYLSKELYERMLIIKKEKNAFIKSYIIEEHSELTIDDNIEIKREIEFTPETKQAGLSILTYFGTVIDENYPEQNARVKIEQNKQSVKMTIETSDGIEEVIEEALEEYQMVMQKQISPEEFYSDPIKVIELKAHIREVENKYLIAKDMIKLQEGTINTLNSVISCLTKKTQMPITITNIQNTNVDINNNFSEIISDLKSLLPQLNNSIEMQNEVMDLNESMEYLSTKKDPEEIKESSSLKKLNDFLIRANETGTNLNELFEKAENGYKIVNNLGKKYNSIAKWCGAPIIPFFDS